MKSKKYWIVQFGAPMVASVSRNFYDVILEYLKAMPDNVDVRTTVKALEN